MIKKSLGYIVLMMLLVVGKPSLAMHQVAFRTAKIIGVGTLPTLGLVKAYSGLKRLKEQEDKATDPIACKVMVEAEFSPLHKIRPLSGDTDRWVRKEIERFGDSYPQSLPIMSVTHPIVELHKTLLQVKKEFGSDSPMPENAKSELGACVVSDKILVIEDNGDLNNIVQNRDSDPRGAALLSMILAHEMKHRNNQDTKKRHYFNAIFPLIAQGAYFSGSHAFNKRYGVTPPQTFLKTALRSSLAISSIVPKLSIWMMSLKCYDRYQEARADEYACQHAQNRLELEAFRDYFKAYEEKRYGPCVSDQEKRQKHSESRDCHPYPGDRVAMMQKYLDKMDCKV